MRNNPQLQLQSVSPQAEHILRVTALSKFVPGIASGLTGTSPVWLREFSVLLPVWFRCSSI